MKIKDVKVNAGRRKVDSQKVTLLAESINKLGLLNAITVNKDFTLIAGMHRLEACKLLGYEDISANVIDLDVLLAELAELHENLVRLDLHWLEQDKQLKRCKEIYEELHPETKQGIAGGKASGISRGTKGIMPSVKKTFTKDTAEKIGQSQTKVKRSVQRGEKIIEEIEEDIIALDITKTEGTILARFEPEQQKQIIEVKKEKRESSIKDIVDNIKKEENKTKVINLELQEVQTKSHTAILHNVDCLNYLKNLDIEIDLLITDPPYFTDGDFTSHVLNYLNKVKKTGQAYVFASADPKEVLSYIQLQPINLKLEQILIWNYNNGGQLQPKTRYNSNYQICFYYRGIDAQQINKPTDGKHQYACQTINAPDGRIGDRYHKWQKPNELIERLIKNSSNLDDFIFDPFAGTSTTLVSAVKLGRRAEGCEIDLEAVKISNKRGVQNGI